MPSLRTLHLECVHPFGSIRFVVCPPGSHIDVPSTLTSFTLSWLSPADQVFSELPRTLRHLSLLDSPRVHSLGNVTGWLPILTGRDMLQILAAARLPLLESLAFLYYGGGERVRLLCWSS